MRITTELRNKIDRAFGAKKTELRAKHSKELEELYSEPEKIFTEQIANLKNNEKFSTLINTIETYVVKKLYKPSSFSLAFEMAHAFTNEEIENKKKELFKLENNLDKQKEEFLIALSYAGGDMESIKAIFKEYKLDF